MKKIFKGKVEKGKLIIENSKEYNLFVWSLNNKNIELTLGKPSKKRSNQENRYYWGVVLRLLSDQTGYTENEMHDALRLLFLRDNTKIIPTLLSTALLNTIQFEEYMSKIRIWASTELSVYIPEPNEIDYNEQ